MRSSNRLPSKFTLHRFWGLFWSIFNSLGRGRIRTKKSNTICVAARSSQLSRAQVQEVLNELRQHDPAIAFNITWVKTTGDLDKTTSLRTLDKTDFFTKEIDALLLDKCVQLGIHSAKDLPDPLPAGLAVAALTQGIDSSDSLVLRKGEQLATLAFQAKIGTSSIRREEVILSLRSDLRCVDVRGTITERLDLLKAGVVDGLIVAEAALIRLGLTTLNRIRLPGQAAPLQGRLAVVCKENDQEMLSLCKPIDARKKILYLGTDPKFFISPIPYAKVIHCPLIKIRPRPINELKEAYGQLAQCSHILLTSKNAVSIFFSHVPCPQDKIWICVGKTTATYLQEHGVTPQYIASSESQEGIIALLKTLNLKNSRLFIPKSSLSRSFLFDWLSSVKISYIAVDIYDTHPLIPSSLPLIDEMDLIIFTSPSTVDAFIKIWRVLPPEEQCCAIGPVTQSKLRTYHVASPCNAIIDTYPT